MRPSLGIRAAVSGGSLFVEAMEPRRLLSGIPYLGAPVSLPGTVYCVNFDNGGEGVAFHDLDAINHGGVYRNAAVDIVNTPSGYAVGWTAAGEWLRYSVNVTRS